MQNTVDFDDVTWLSHDYVCSRITTSEYLYKLDQMMRSLDEKNVQRVANLLAEGD